MRRLIRIGGIAFVALAAFVAVPQTASAQSLPSAGVSVNVDVRCLPGNGVQFTLAPWNTSLPLGDSVIWVLNQDASVSDITITPKTTAWPFTPGPNGPPYKGNANNPPKGKGMKAGVKVGDKYSYNVTAVCIRASGNNTTVVIDPDMIIIPGK